MANPLALALLELLRCPETGQRLALASPGLLEEVEARRRAGTLRLRAVQPQLDFDGPISAGLLREDGAVLYAIQNGIPLLLPDHGIPVGQSPESGL